RRHTRSKRDWSSDVCSSDLVLNQLCLLYKAIEIHTSEAASVVFEMARKKKNKIVKMLVPASGDVQQQQLHQGHQPHHRHRRVNSNALVPAGGHCWPRDLTKPDLELECLDSIDDGHYHLAHTFPLYLLSVYF